MSNAIEELTAAGTVTIRGTEYTVQPVDGFSYDLLIKASKEGPTAALLATYEVAARCLRGQLSKDEVIGSKDTLGLSADEVGAVVAAAQAKARELEASASPNSEPAGARRTKSRKG